VISQQILLAVQDFDLRQQLKELLTDEDVEVLEVSSTITSILECVHNNHLRLLILESPWNNGTDTLEVAEKIRKKDGRFPIILVTTHGSEALAVSALRMGFKDYFTTPLSPQKFNATVNRCISNYRFQPLCIKTQLVTSCFSVDQQFVGESLLMCKLKAHLQKIATVDSHVLITGETGTGKELTAQYIHQCSTRKAKTFIAINCAAIPDGLLESELFGYEKGAFTGAQMAYAGKLKLADGGTVFLDEIGDMSLYAQAKILRVIESKEVYPLGAKRSVPLDTRIITATNCDLEQLVLKKEFRQDLYFRLNVARVQLPPLRERKEDITYLVDYYIQIFNERFGSKNPGFTNEAWEALLQYDWPGNIRELKNFLEASYIDLPSDRITLKDLPDFICSPCQRGEGGSQAERELLLSALRSVNWNKSKAAEQLRWSRMTLYRKMAKYCIQDIEIGNTF
jgi:DNA-binding NtrC family response regulator